MMKILSPVNNLESAVNQIKAGADEIYLSADVKIFNNFSFSGRGRLNQFNQKISPDFSELEDIVKHAHENNASVMFTANLPFMADNLLGGKIDFKKEYLNYVEKALKANVDSVVVGDLGAAAMIKESGFNCHLSGSSFFETINIEQIHFLENIGFNRVVISYHLTMEDIKKMVSASNIEIELMGHFGCSFYDNCNFAHSFGKSIEKTIEIPCRARYELINDEQVFAKGQVLNSQLMCGLCSLKELDELGIYALKLVGRDLNMKLNYEITNSYRRMIDTLREGNEGNVKQIRDKIVPDWWKPSFCKINSCKFQENPVTNTYI